VSLKQISSLGQEHPLRATFEGRETEPSFSSSRDKMGEERKGKYGDSCFFRNWGLLYWGQKNKGGGKKGHKKQKSRDTRRRGERRTQLISLFSG